jgi:hypothetical protein
MALRGARVERRNEGWERVQAQRFGNLHVAALLAAPIIGEDILLGISGGPVTVADVGGLVNGKYRIGDVIGIEWMNDGRMAFQCRTQVFPLSDKHARAFRRLCDILGYNYPGVIRNPGPAADLQTKVPTLDTWQLRKQDGYHELLWNPLGDVWVGAEKVATTAEAAKAARHLSGNPAIQFHAHVWIDGVQTLWKGARTYTQSEASSTITSSSREREVPTQLQIESSLGGTARRP